jgi:hypothetical protein
MRIIIFLVLMLPILTVAQNTELDELKALAEQGDVAAQHEVARIYDNGRGVSENDAEAVKWYRLAADQGYADAQYNLGIMYTKGLGVPEDFVEAIKWYRLAAEQENAEAQTNLGAMYDSGKGVPENAAEAVKWYRLAADQGNARSQHNLGHMYLNGEGVPADEVEAIKWFRLAADQGNADAQSYLGFMYGNGKAVPINYLASYFWLSVASAQGHQDAKANLESVKKVLTEEQVAQGQIAASKCGDSNFKDCILEESRLFEEESRTKFISKFDSITDLRFLNLTYEYLKNSSSASRFVETWDRSPKGKNNSFTGSTYLGGVPWTNVDRQNYRSHLYNIDLERIIEGTDRVAGTNIFSLSRLVNTGNGGTAYNLSRKIVYSGETASEGYYSRDRETQSYTSITPNGNGSLFIHQPKDELYFLQIGTWDSGKFVSGDTIIVSAGWAIKAEGVKFSRRGGAEVTNLASLWVEGDPPPQLLEKYFRHIQRLEFLKGDFSSARDCDDVSRFLDIGQVYDLRTSVFPTPAPIEIVGALSVFGEESLYIYVPSGFITVETSPTGTVWFDKEKLEFDGPISVVGVYEENRDIEFENGTSDTRPLIHALCIQ